MTSTLDRTRQLALVASIDTSLASRADLAFGGQEAQRGEDRHHERGTEEQQLRAHGDECQRDAAEANQNAADADPEKSLRRAFGIEWAKEYHESRHAVEERDGNLLERVHAANAGDGNRKETNRREPLEVSLPFREVLFSKSHRN